VHEPRSVPGLHQVGTQPQFFCQAYNSTLKRIIALFSHNRTLESLDREFGNPNPCKRCKAEHFFQHALGLSNIEEKAQTHQDQSLHVLRIDDLYELPFFWIPSEIPIPKTQVF
jgi:hypothetical protein